jgi:hypothetical protein
LDTIAATDPSFWVAAIWAEVTTWGFAADDDDDDDDDDGTSNLEKLSASNLCVPGNLQMTM